MLAENISAKGTGSGGISSVVSLRPFVQSRRDVIPETLPSEVTQLLGQWTGGKGEAVAELMPLVYEELRRMAHRHMAQERGGHTLQATALVNEAYLKLKDGRLTQLQNRAKFFLPWPRR